MASQSSSKIDVGLVNMPCPLSRWVVLPALQIQNFHFYLIHADVALLLGLLFLFFKLIIYFIPPSNFVSSTVLKFSKSCLLGRCRHHLKSQNTSTSTELVYASVFWWLLQLKKTNSETPLHAHTHTREGVASSSTKELGHVTHKGKELHGERRRQQLLWRGGLRNVQIGNNSAQTNQCQCQIQIIIDQKKICK